MQRGRVRRRSTLRSSTTFCSVSALVRAGIECGREDRSCNPASPSVSYRQIHLPRTCGKCPSPPRCGPSASLRGTDRRSAPCLRRGSGITAGHENLRLVVGHRQATPQPEVLFSSSRHARYQRPGRVHLTGLRPSPTRHVVVGVGFGAGSRRDSRSEWPTATTRYADEC